MGAYRNFDRHGYCRSHQSSICLVGWLTRWPGGVSNREANKMNKENIIALYAFITFSLLYFFTFFAKEFYWYYFIGMTICTIILIPRFAKKRFPFSKAF